MPAEPVERSWRAMGSDASVIIVGGPPSLADRAVARVEELEDRWSRFRPHSEVSRLGRTSGRALPVSPDTIRLLELAREAWELTGGRFDPTVGAAVIAAGYDESFDRFDGRPRSVDRGASTPGRGLGAIEIDREGGTVTIDPDVRLDVGGLGKGLAADLVVDELLAAGAAGALVSLGGDLCARGAGVDDGSWLVGIADPFDPPTDLVVAALREGAVATSSTLRRRWMTTDGLPAHHIIDPSTGRPATSDVVAATVIAADAATAEVLATAAIVGGRRRAEALVDDLGAGAVVVEGDGRRHVLGAFEAFLVHPFPLGEGVS